MAIAQGHDMEGNQRAMQLSTARGIMSMGWDRESKRPADAMIDCANRSPEGRDEREERASQNRMTSTQNGAATRVADIDNHYDPFHRCVLK